MPGYIPQEDLPALYSSSIAFIYPSHYEGFGLPILEAMASEVPVIASNIEIHLEVAGQVPLYFHNTNASELCNHMIASEKNMILRKKHIELGIQHVKKYSWISSATKFLSCFDRFNL